jgi:hypothetical protein
MSEIENKTIEPDLSVTVFDLLLQSGWQEKYLRKCDNAASLDFNNGETCFRPFYRKFRIFQTKTLPVSAILSPGDKIKFCPCFRKMRRSVIKRNVGFLGYITLNFLHSFQSKYDPEYFFEIAGLIEGSSPWTDFPFGEWLYIDKLGQFNMTLKHGNFIWHTDYTLLTYTYCVDVLSNSFKNHNDPA